MVKFRKKAITYFEKALFLGVADAATKLGNIYDCGPVSDSLQWLGNSAIPVNKVQAVRYYERAIELGDTSAFNNLASFISPKLEFSRTV